MSHVHPRLKFIPQQFNVWVLKLVHTFVPAILRFRLQRWLVGGIVRVEAEGVEELVELYQQFQAGKLRFLIAFRHAEVEDPLCMLHLMSRCVPQTARQQGVILQSPIHTHFIYDRGMTIWAGNWLGWLFSRGGGLPIHRGKPLDRTALRAARELLINGKFPLTVAPEGGTNGHGEIVSVLEPGLAQLGFWCVEDLHKANRTEAVYIVPIGIRYYFVTPPWQKIEKLLSQLEDKSGLSGSHSALNQSKNPAYVLYPRLLRLGEHLLTQMEDFYRRFYRLDFPPINASLDPNHRLAERLQNLLDKALKVAEDYFGLPSQGTIVDRCRRLEEVGWNRIYREDIEDLRDLSALQSGLAEWVAEEADLRLKHMRLVESFVAVTGSYVKEKPTAERFAETLSILYDCLSRIESDRIPRRPQLGKRRVKLTVGKPILVSDRWLVYHSSRKSAKQAVQQLTEDIQGALEALI